MFMGENEVLKTKQWEYSCWKMVPEEAEGRQCVGVGGGVQGFTQKEKHLFLNLHQDRDDQLKGVYMGLGTESFCSLSWAWYTSEITGSLLKLWWIMLSLNAHRNKNWREFLGHPREWQKRPRASPVSSLCKSRSQEREDVLSATKA